MTGKERGAYGKNMIRFTVKSWTNNLPEDSVIGKQLGEGVYEGV